MNWKPKTQTILWVSRQDLIKILQTQWWKHYAAIYRSEPCINESNSSHNFLNTHIFSHKQIESGTKIKTILLNLFSVISFNWPFEQWFGTKCTKLIALNIWNISESDSSISLKNPNIQYFLSTVCIQAIEIKPSLELGHNKI